MRCWESPGDHPVIPKNVCKNLLFLLCRPTQTLDTSLHSGLLYKLLTNNVGCKCFNVIQNIYSLYQSAIKIDNKHSDYFKIERGVKQGDSLSLVYLTIL